MQLGDVYLIQQEFELSADQDAVLNHFYQVVTAEAASVAVHIDTTFATVVQAQMAGLMDENYTIRRRLCININDPDDFNETFPNVVGTRTGSQLPTAMTATIRSPRQGPGYRYSYRHYPFGVASDIETTEGAWAGGFLTSLVTLANALGAALSPGPGGSLEPCQVASGWKYGFAPTVRQLLDSNWSVLSNPGWLRSRQTR